MKVKVEFITARLDSKLLIVESIQDCYTSVQLHLDMEDLDDVSIQAFRKDKFARETGYNTFYIGEFEAKDICGVYGNLVVAMESKIIDFE